MLSPLLFRSLMMPNFKASVAIRSSEEPLVSLALMRPHGRGNSGVCGGGRGGRWPRLVASLQLCVLDQDPSHVVQAGARGISDNCKYHHQHQGSGNVLIRLVWNVKLPETDHDHQNIIINKWLTTTSVWLITWTVCRRTYHHWRTSSRSSGFQENNSYLASALFSLLDVDHSQKIGDWPWNEIGLKSQLIYPPLFWITDYSLEIASMTELPNLQLIYRLLATCLDTK